MRGQMLRQRAAIGASFSGAFAALGGAALIFLGLDLSNRLLDMLKCEFKLILIELFGRAAVLGIAGYAQQMLKLLAAGYEFAHESLQGLRIGGKLLRRRIVRCSSL